MFKKLLLTAILGSTGLLYANINAVVSILPEKTFVEAIGGDKVTVSLMVQPGNSPHTYEPKPSQMKDINNADIYFSFGVEFEESWLPKFASQNKKMKIENITEGITKIPMGKHTHDEHEVEKKEHEQEVHEHDEHESSDPHVWTSTANVKIIAKNIYTNLVKLDSENEDYYKNNYEKFLERIIQTDIAIKKLLIDTPTGTKFMVFHPSWGYFARDYGLVQVAIEAGGKNPKPKQVAYLIEEAKEEKVKAVFVAFEFSDKVATQIANEVGIPVIKISPLEPKWSENLIKLARAIANK